MCAVIRVKQGPPTLGQGKFPWWTWTGGLLGAVYVLANIYLSGILGTGMTVIILLVGATAGGAVIDHFGLLGAAQKSLTVRKVVGILGLEDFIKSIYGIKMDDRIFTISKSYLHHEWIGEQSLQE